MRSSCSCTAPRCSTRPAQRRSPVSSSGDLFYERAAASALWAWLRTAHRQGVQVLIADASRQFAPTAGVRCLWEERLATAWAWEGTHARTVRLLTLDV
jgi:predicted nicotinamide N-methyase